jgi:hypothetical protein
LILAQVLVSLLLPTADDKKSCRAKSTAHDRFQAWAEAVVFLQLWQAGVERFDELKGIEWEAG